MSLLFAEEVLKGSLQKYIIFGIKIQRSSENKLSSSALD